jgi:hypothetical protein
VCDNSGVRKALRYICGVALFVAGFYALLIGQISLIDIHIRPASVLGVTFSIIAIELFVFAFWIVRLIPGEIVFRIALYLLVTVFTLSQLLWAISDVMFPVGTSAAGIFVDETAGTKITRFLLAAIGGANLFLIYRWVGIGWRTRLRR